MSPTGSFKRVVLASSKPSSPQWAGDVARSMTPGYDCGPVAAGAVPRAVAAHLTFCQVGPDVPTYGMFRTGGWLFLTFPEKAFSLIEESGVWPPMPSVPRDPYQER